VAVCVVDDGPGVSENRKQAIFEAYERGHASVGESPPQLPSRVPERTTVR